MRKMIALIGMITLVMFCGKKETLAQNALVASGPSKFLPCRGAWVTQCDNAVNSFVDLGYDVERLTWPTKKEMQQRISDPSYEIFFLAGHADSFQAKWGCEDGDWSEIVTAKDIEQWLEDQPPITFTYYLACGGACQSGEDTMTYALTKGYQPDSAVVSFCGMDQPECKACWNVNGWFQIDFFDALADEETVGNAFDQMMVLYPECQECIFLEGDHDLRLVEEPEPTTTTSSVEVETTTTSTVEPKTTTTSSIQPETTTTTSVEPETTTTSTIQPETTTTSSSQPETTTTTEPEPPVIYGDVYPLETYGDNEINICDIMYVVDFILTRTEPKDWQAIRADVPNGTPSIGCTLPDQKIDILDIMVLIDKALTRNNCIDEY